MVGGANDGTVGNLAVSVDITDATTTSLKPGSTTPNSGQSITLTATVATVGGGSGIPSGTVEFYDGTIKDMTSDTHVYQTAGDYLIQAIATSSAGSFSAMLNNDAYPALDTTFGSGGTVSGVAETIRLVRLLPYGQPHPPIDSHARLLDQPHRAEPAGFAHAALPPLPSIERTRLARAIQEPGDSGR